MEKRYYFIAQTYVNLKGGHVTFLAFKEGAYGMHMTCDINDENICYYSTEENAIKVANICNRNSRTVHSKFLDYTPNNLD